MKRFLKILPVVLCISLNTLNTYAADAKHSDLPFEEYAYEHMEIDALDETITKIKDTLVISGEEKTVDKLITEMEDYNNALNRNIAIAYIYSDLDAADPYWDNEVSYNDALLAESSDRIYAAYHEIAVSPYADVLKKRIDTWEYILQYTPLTDEQKALLKEESRLMLLYDTLCVKEYKDPYGMTEEELFDAYMDKTISIEQYRKGYADIYTQKNSEWGEVFVELTDIRTQIAKSFGYDNYAEYAYKEIYGREYAPDDLSAFREDVKIYLVPLRDELYQMLYVGKEYQKLHQKSISADECLATLQKYCISEDMSESYRYMTDHHLYDISDDSKKTPGAYTIAIPGYNAPFLYHKSNGNILDMETLIHEFGHFNQLYHMDADSWYYNRKNTDLAEVHSQGLELLFLTYADEIYGKDADVMKLYVLYDLVNSCIEGVKEDDFQCRVYDYVSGPGNKSFTVSAANHLYGDVCSEYGGKVYCDDHYLSNLIPGGEDYSWIGIGHTFKAPMYYISYAVSAAAVFELLDKNDDRIQAYNELVRLGFTENFSKTMEVAGLNDPITTPRFEEYAKDIRGCVHPIQVRYQMKSKIPLIAFALAVIIILAIQHKKSLSPKNPKDPIHKMT